VLIYDDDFYLRKVKCLEVGNYFGEVGLIYNIRRTATIRSIGYCTYATLSKMHFNNLIKNYGGIKTKLLL
jgi:CRP-like cAMP-binding protein